MAKFRNKKKKSWDRKREKEKERRRSEERKRKREAASALGRWLRRNGMKESRGRGGGAPRAPRTRKLGAWKREEMGYVFLFHPSLSQTHSSSVLVYSLWIPPENFTILSHTKLFFIQCSSILHGFCKTKHGNWLDLGGKDGFVGFESEEEREERFRGGAAMVYGEKRRRNKVKDLWVYLDLRWGNDGFGGREREMVCAFVKSFLFFIFFLTMSCLQVDIFFP